MAGKIGPGRSSARRRLDRGRNGGLAPGRDRYSSFVANSSRRKELDLKNEAPEVKAQGMKFIKFPIPDRQVPGSQSELTALLQEIDADLSGGSNVAIHCRQGVGRTGLVAACLLVSGGLSSTEAINAVSAARGNTVPETDEQHQWIDHYAAVLASAK